MIEKLKEFWENFKRSANSEWRTITAQKLIKEKFLKVTEQKFIKKKILSPLVSLIAPLLIIVIIGLIVSFNLINNDWLIYEDKKYDFAIDYPATKKIFESEKEAKKFIIKNWIFFGTKEIVFLEIIGNQKPDLLLEEIQKKHQRTPLINKDISFESREVARQLVFETAAGDKIHYYLILRGQTIYLLNALESDAELMKMIKTFRFIELGSGELGNGVSK